MHSNQQKSPSMFGVALSQIAQRTCFTIDPIHATSSSPMSTASASPPAVQLAAVKTRQPPPAGLKSPALWGTAARLDELFGRAARQIRTTRRDFTFRYRTPAHWIEVFRTYYGPMNKALARSMRKSRLCSPPNCWR
jgi:hypothetical protein